MSIASYQAVKGKAMDLAADAGHRGTMMTRSRLCEACAALYGLTSQTVWHCALLPLQRGQGLEPEPKLLLDCCHDLHLLD